MLFQLKCCELLHNCKSKCSAVAEMGDHLATIDMVQKLGAVPFFGGEGTGSPSNTMWPGSMPSLDWPDPNSIAL